MLETRFHTNMDSTSPIAARIAGQTSAASGTFFKPFFAMGSLTLVENTFVGRRWLCGRQRGDGHRRYREHHHRSAGGHGRAS